MLIVDAHLDLAMNAIEWNRDLSRPIDEIRAREQGIPTGRIGAKGTVSFAEMRRGKVGLCVATQIARYSTREHPFPGWHSPEQAWAMTQAQLAWYRTMEERGELVQVKDAAGLEQHLTRVGRRGRDGPIGYILSLEGADSLVTIGHLERAYGYGLRAVGPAHYGPGVYAQGTNAQGDLGARGRELVREMDRLGMILDATHLCDESFRDALDHFRGPGVGQPLELPFHRQPQPPVQRRPAARAHRTRRGHRRRLRRLDDRARLGARPVDAGEAGVTLDRLIDHIDHICQLAGNARHCGIGRTSTAASAASSVPPTSQRSPTCRSCPRCSPPAATAKPTSNDHPRQLHPLPPERPAVSPPTMVPEL